MIAMRATYYATAPAIVLIVLLAISQLCNDRFHIWWIIASLFGVLIFSVVYTFNRLSVFSVLALLALHAQWGIAQFIFQHDLGFQRSGESVLSAQTVAVAKFSVGSNKVIRAYGPYLHANVFGGMMLIGLLLTASYAPPLWKRYLSAVFIVAIILSFSRAAYVGVLLIPLVTRAVPWRRFGIGIGITCLVITPLVVIRFSDPADRAISERLRGYAWAAKIITHQGVVQGLGIGNYPVTLRAYLQDSHIPFQPWELAPVHSVPLLLIAELGLIPALGFLGAVAVIRSRRQLLLLIPLVPSLLLDHYFMTDITPAAMLMMLLFSV